MSVATGGVGDGDPASSPAYLVDAADKALQLVLLLQSRDSVGVSEAGAHLDVARSTAHRLLATLRHRGFRRPVRRPPIPGRPGCAPR